MRQNAGFADEKRSRRKPAPDVKIKKWMQRKSVTSTRSGKSTVRGYNAPCFAGVVHCFMGSGLKRRDNGTSGTKCGVLPRGLLSDAPFSVNRRFPLSKFYPGCLLNTPNKRAKTHACVFNARVRFYFIVRYLAPAPFPSSDSCPASFNFCRIRYA